jgi:hypothetical protein
MNKKIKYEFSLRYFKERFIIWSFNWIGNRTKFQWGVILWTLIALFFAAPFLFHSFTSITIADKTIKIFRGDAPVIYFGKFPTEKQVRESIMKRKYWDGSTLNAVLLNTSHGVIDIPKKSHISVALGVITFTNNSGFDCSLNILNNKISKGLESINLLADGELIAFTAYNGAIPMTINSIKFEALTMKINEFKVYGVFEDIISKNYRFECANMESIKLDKDSEIIFDNTRKHFYLYLKENEYGFYSYTLISNSRNAFILKHPSLEKEIQIYQVDFDVSYDAVTAYKINQGEELIKLPYKEKIVDKKWKTEEQILADEEQALFNESLRELAEIISGNPSPETRKKY